jgi:hypothetical protein
MDTSLNVDGMCPGVFVAYLTNECGQRICFRRRRLRAKLAKEEYATTWQEEDEARGTRQAKQRARRRKPETKRKPETERKPEAKRRWRP